MNMDPRALRKSPEPIIIVTRRLHRIISLSPTTTARRSPVRLVPRASRAQGTLHITGLGNTIHLLRTCPHVKALPLPPAIPRRLRTDRAAVVPPQYLPNTKYMQAPPPSCYRSKPYHAWPALFYRAIILSRHIASLNLDSAI